MASSVYNIRDKRSGARMKSKVLEKIWIILAALGIGVSLFINNSNKLIESNASNFSNAIISKK